MRVDKKIFDKQIGSRELLEKIRNIKSERDTEAFKWGGVVGILGAELGRIEKELRVDIISSGCGSNIWNKSLTDYLHLDAPT